MKKILLSLFFLAMMISAFTQTTMPERKMLPGKLDTLLLDYFNYAKLYSLDETGFSDEVAQKFSNLFTAGATITDEVNPAFYDKNFTHPHDLTVRSVQDYISHTKQNFPNGINVKYNALQVDYNTLTVAMVKETKGTTKTGLYYVINDTSLMKLQWSADLRSLKIQEISVSGKTIASMNDADNDFTPDAIDNCPKVPGFINPDGCPTKEEKAALASANAKNKTPVVPGPVIPGLFLGLSIAGGTNTMNTNFDETNLGYDQLIKGDNHVYHNSGYKQKKSAPFLQLQLDLEYYFGKKKNIGIATGIGFSSFNAGFAMDSFHAEYSMKDRESRIYRRVSSVNNISEELKMQSINIPLLLQYKFKPEAKINMILGLGINYHKVNSTKVSAKATADYEAIYQFEGSTRLNPVSVFDNGVTPSGNSWLITRNNVEAHNGQSQEQEYFTKKRADGYDVALDEALQKKETLSVKGAMGIIARVNLNFKLSEKAAFVVLFQYQSISFSNKSVAKNYTITDEIGTYNVLLKNVGTLKTGSPALGVGIKFTIK